MGHSEGGRSLAHRIDGLKREVVQFIEAAREIEVAVLSHAMKNAPDVSSMGPTGLSVTITSLALLLSRESQMGITAGHTEITQALNAFLDQLEPL